MCIEEAPSLWPPGTVCQCGPRAWAQSNASSWHCAYDTSNSLNCVQLTVMHVLSLFFWFLHVFSSVFDFCTYLCFCFGANSNLMLQKLALFLVMFCRIQVSVQVSVNKLNIKVVVFLLFFF